MTRSLGWPVVRNVSSMPSYSASATPINVKPSTATVAPSGMAATASRTEASLTPRPEPQRGPEKPSQYVSAADVDDFARDVACLVRRQKRDHGRHIGGLSHAAQRNLRHLLVADRVRDAACHLRIDKSWADGVHRDLCAGQFFCGRDAQADYAGFGGGVIRLADIAHPAGRRNIHDAAGAGPAHDAARRSSHEEDAGKINGDDLMPLFVRHLVEHGIAIDTGIVDQNVQPAESRLNVVDKRIALA